MELWHKVLKRDQTKIDDFMEYYKLELKEAKAEVRKLGNIEKLSQQLPAIMETRYSQLQDVEITFKVMETELEALESKTFKKYFENYNRTLTSTECKKYVEGDYDVVQLKMLIYDIAYIRNQYLGIIKALEMKGWQLSNIAKMRIAGIEDASLS